MIENMNILVPPIIQAGIDSGDLVRTGSVVRDQGGRIVKQLQEVFPPAEVGNALTRAATALNKPQVYLVVAGVSVLAVGGVVAYNARQKAKQRVVEELMASYYSSMSTYLRAGQKGNLNSELLDQLISDLDAVRENLDSSGRFRLDLVAHEGEVLLGLVIANTNMLATAHSVELGPELRAPEQDRVLDLRRHLEVQRKIFHDAA